MKTTPNFNTAEWSLFNYLKGKGFSLRVGQVKDFRLQGDESDDEIERYAEEFIANIDADTDVAPSKETRKHGWWE